MAKSPPPLESTNVEANSTNGEDQATFVENVARRVRAAASARGFNATSLGNELDMAPSSAANYWSGKRAWPIDVLPELSRALGISVGEILTGKRAEVLRDDAPAYRGPAPEQDDMVEIAQIDLRYGLGASYLDSAVEAEPRQFSRAWLREVTRAPTRHLFWALGDGDSMEPTIRSGELILIERSQDTLRASDGIWAVAMGEIGMVKRLRPLPDGTVELLSDNKLVPSQIAADGELHLIGRVVAVVRRL